MWEKDRLSGKRTLKRKRVIRITRSPGRFHAAELILASSFKKAMIEPVNVMPPIKSPRIPKMFSMVTPVSAAFA